VLFDRVRVQVTNAGGTSVRIGDPIPGFQDFNAADIADGTEVSYAIEEGEDWETGTGVYDADTGTLARTLSESSTGALLVLGGAAVLSITLLSKDIENGLTLIKHKPAAANTYARTIKQLQAVGGRDDENLMHWINPDHDEELIAGTNVADLKVQIANAIAVFKAQQLSTGRRQRMFIPDFEFYYSSNLSFDVPDLILDAKGAVLTSDSPTFAPLLQLIGARMEVHGLRVEFTAGAGAENYFNVVGEDTKLFGVSYKRDATSSIPLYVRADGFRWYGGELDAYGGLNAINAGDAEIDGVFFHQPDGSSGTDDAIAIKATNKHVIGWRVSNCSFRNKADFIAIGSEVGKVGANDPNRTVGVFGVVAKNLTGERCSTAFFIKPGGIYDYRDGTVQGVRGRNIVLRDREGIWMQKPVALLPGRGASIKDIDIEVTAEGRHYTTGGAPRAGVFHLYMVDSTGIGAFESEVANINIKGSFDDPYDGIAAGGVAPGAPTPNVVLLEKQNPAYGQASDINLDITSNGNETSAIRVQAGFDGAVYIEKAHLANVNTNGSSSFGGIHTDSIIEISTDHNITMAAGSSGRRFVNGGSGEVRTRAEHVGLEPKITLKSKAGAVGLAKGSISFTDDLDAEYAWIGDRDAVNRLFTISAGAGTLSLLGTSVDLTSKFTQTAANVTSTITNSSGNPTNVPLLTFTRLSNIAAPAATGTALLIVDHALNYSFSIQNAGGTVKFRVGPNGDTTVGGALAVTGALTASNLSGTNTGDQFTNLTSSRFLGRVTAGFGAAEQLTGTQATALLDVFTTGLKGLVPASPGGATNFLREDGAWAAPTAGAGGADRQLQFNNGGALAGADQVDIDATGNLRFDHGANSSAPAADQVELLFQRIAAGGGRLFPRMRGEDGVYTSFQTHLGRNSISWAQAQGGTAGALQGIGYSNLSTTGTATIRNPAAGNRLTRAKRNAWVSAAGAGSTASMYNSTAGQHNQWTVGGVAGGGFLAAFRFGVSDAAPVAGAHMFVGLRSALAAPVAATNPSTLTNVIGLAQLNGGANLHIVYGGSAAQAAIDLGATFPAADTTALYELILYARPDDATKVAYRVENITTGAVASGVLTGAAGVALPANTTFIGPALYRSNNATALAVGIDIAGFYIESDFA
jgi:hypothetical protein